MKKIFLALLLFSFCHRAYALDGKVVGVTDGDTIKVLKEDNTLIKVRLYGIDTPEKNQPYGNKAKEFIASLVAGKEVYVEEFGFHFERMLGVVFVDDTNVNQTIVEAGMAWVYRKYCKKVFCAEWCRLEAAAREENRGLFADPHAMPPWGWRKERRERRKN